MCVLRPVCGLYVEKFVLIIYTQVSGTYTFVHNYYEFRLSFFFSSGLNRWKKLIILLIWRSLYRYVTWSFTRAYNRRREWLYWNCSIYTYAIATKPIYFITIITPCILYVELGLLVWCTICKYNNVNLRGEGDQPHRFFGSRRCVWKQ